MCDECWSSSQLLRLHHSPNAQKNQDQKPRTSRQVEFPVLVEFPPKTPKIVKVEARRELKVQQFGVQGL